MGLRSFPHLADHAFQNMIVLPGSFCIEAALHLHLAVGRPGILQNIEFRRPVILSDEELPIKIEVREVEPGLLEYVFSEAIENSWFARLEIANAEPNKRETAAFSGWPVTSGTFSGTRKILWTLASSQIKTSFEP